MIPRVIHYCWFGRAEKTPLILQCIDTWRHTMPDYELKEWNEQNFDIEHAAPFVREAYEARQWAFVADYVRLYALYSEGGIYMDTDVKTIRRFDPFLQYSFFSCQESHPDILDPASILPDGRRNPSFEHVYGIGLCSAVMGAEAGNAYLRDCLNLYADLHFDISRKRELIIVNLIARILEQYGYRYVLDKEQHLDGNIAIFCPHTFAGITTFNDQSYALHLYNGSWLDNSDSLKHRLRNQFPTLYTFLQNCLRFTTGKRLLK